MYLDKLKEDKKMFIVEITEYRHVLIEAENEAQAKEDAIRFAGISDIDKDKVVVNLLD